MVPAEEVDLCHTTRDYEHLADRYFRDLAKVRVSRPVFDLEGLNLKGRPPITYDDGCYAWLGHPGEELPIIFCRVSTFGFSPSRSYEHKLTRISRQVDIHCVFDSLLVIPENGKTSRKFFSSGAMEGPAYEHRGTRKSNFALV